MTTHQIRMTLAEQSRDSVIEIDGVVQRDIRALSLLADASDRIPARLMLLRAYDDGRATFSNTRVDVDGVVVIETDLRETPDTPVDLVTIERTELPGERAIVDAIAAQAIAQATHTRALEAFMIQDTDGALGQLGDVILAAKRYRALRRLLDGPHATIEIEDRAGPSEERDYTMIYSANQLDAQVDMLRIRHAADRLIAGRATPEIEPMLPDRGPSHE